MAMRPRRGRDTAMPARRAAQPVFEDFKPMATWQEDNENHVIAIDLPGFVKEEIRVRTEPQNIIRVSGDHLVTRNKRRRFQEDFQVPENGEINLVRAKFQGGTLTITIPKKIVHMPPKVEQPSRAETPPKIIDLPPKEALPSRAERPPKVIGMPSEEALPPRIETPPMHNLPTKLASPEVPKPPTPQKAQNKVHPAVSASQPTDDSGVKRRQKDAQRHGRSGTPFIDAGRVLPRDLEIGDIKGRPVTEEKHEKEENTSKVREGFGEAPTAMKPELDIRNGAAATSGAKPKHRESKRKQSTHIDGAQHEASAMDKYKKIAAKELTELNEERQLLVNMGVAVLVIMAVSAYVTYKFTSGRDIN